MLSWLNESSKTAEPSLRDLVDLSTEQLLLSRAQQGEYAAFEEMVAPMRVWLYRLCFGILKDGDLAEHTTLVALEKAWRAIGTCKGAFRPWLYRITHNQALGVINKAEYRRTVSLNGDAETAPSAGSENSFEDGVISQHDLEAALSRLPKPYQDILRLRYYSDLDWNEVADVVGISSVNARKRHERAISHLRSVFVPASELPTPGRSAE